MAGKLLLACEGLRVELEELRKRAPASPEIIYMAQGLHNEPDKMRAEVGAKIAEIEESRPEIDVILLGYGLCGRGIRGVVSRRVTLVIPRVHDCVPLYAGVAQDELGMTEENSGVLWLSAGMMEYGQISKHLVEERHSLYRERYGEKRAEKMIRAENSVFSNYRGVWYVKWPGLDEKYSRLARAVARELSLPYAEIAGKPDFLGDLLAGVMDEKRFLRLEPGQTIDMDENGEIVSITL